MSHFSGTPREDSPAHTPRPGGAEDENEDGASPRGQSMVATDPADEEYYTSADCGWFPFSLHKDQDGVSALVIDPLTEPSVDDAAPKTIALCDACTTIIDNAESVTAGVDRHYKPMTLETTVVDGWVEKLGGGRITRWQRRWLAISEQSVDWYDDQPKPGAKPKIRGTRTLQQNDDFCVTGVQTTFDPRQFPKTTDPKFHYFAITYKNPVQQTLYRTASAEDKNRFVAFISRLIKRWEQHGGASRDPVFWKQWADSVLTATCDVEDECREREDAFDDEEREAMGLREAIQRVKNERPPLLDANSARLRRVETLKAQLRELDEVRARHRKSAEHAESKVALEEVRLNDLVQECSEEARHNKFLEQRAEEQRREVAADIRELDDEIQHASEAKRRAFAQWRKLEEHHSDRALPKKALREFSFSLDL